MAVFGRDSLLTSFQSLPFVPELAAATLRALAILQARKRRSVSRRRAGEDPARDPAGRADRVRGSAPVALLRRRRRDDAVPDPARGVRALDGGHATLVRELEREARAAVAWIDDYGDRDKDGYVEYERRQETGLDNQCWKDSWDSIAFADGTLAPTPRATCELQGYVYDAKRRVRAPGAGGLGRSGARPTGWSSEAAELKQRFNRDFWIPERGFFALALDGKKRKVDSLTSNIGHLLWSGIADDDKADRCVKHLMSDELFSGWGIRTMATTEGFVQPDRLPRRHGLAARQLVRRLGPAPLRLPGGGGEDLPRDPGGGGPVRRAASRGVRRLPALEDALPGRVPDRLQPAGLGDGRAAAGAAHAAGARLRRQAPDRRSRDPGAARSHRAAQHSRLLGADGRVRPRHPRHR